MASYPVTSTVLLIGVITLLASFLFLPYDFHPEDEEEGE
jgi:hypothetical protein